MKKERLVVGAVMQKLRPQDDVIKPNPRAARRMERQADREAIRMVPVLALNECNNKVIGVVERIAEDAQEIDVRVGRPSAERVEVHKKIVIPIDRVMKSVLTPNHIAMCGVAYVREIYSYQNDRERAQFSFGIVPAELMQHFIDEPHDLESPDRDDVIGVGGVEQTPREWDILSTGNLFSVLHSRRLRNRAMAPLVAQVFRAEESLDLLTGAMAQRNLANPVDPTTI